MSDLSELILGLGLIAFSAIVMLACRPRAGKPIALVTKPFIGPSLSILVTATFVIGLIFLAAYFTTIDDTTLSGVIKHS